MRRSIAAANNVGRGGSNAILMWDKSIPDRVKVRPAKPFLTLDIPNKCANKAEVKDQIA